MEILVRRVSYMEMKIEKLNENFGGAKINLSKKNSVFGLLTFLFKVYCCDAYRNFSFHFS